MRSAPSSLGGQPVAERRHERQVALDLVQRRRARGGGRRAACRGSPRCCRRSSARRPAGAAAPSAAPTGGSWSGRRPGRSASVGDPLDQARRSPAGRRGDRRDRSTAPGTHRRRATPGSSSAAARPFGPHSSVTASPMAATARTAGPASRTSPRLSRRTTSVRAGHHRGPISRSTAAPEIARPRRRRRRSPRAASHRSGTRMPRAPARRAASTSAPMSPIDDAALDGSTPSVGGGRTDEAGCRLAARAAVVLGRACRSATARAGRGAPRPARSPRRRRRCRAGPRATPLWLVTTASRHAGDAQAVERLAGPGHRLDGRGVPVVRHVAHQRAVAVEQHGGRAARRARGAGRRAAPAQPLERRSGGMAALVTTMRAISASVRGPGRIRATANAGQCPAPATRAAAPATARSRPTGEQPPPRSASRLGAARCRRRARARLRRRAASAGRGGGASACRRRCRPAGRC